MTPDRFNSPLLENIRLEEWAHLGFWKEGVFSSCCWEGYYKKDIVESLGLSLEDEGTFTLSGGHIFYHLPTRASLEAQMRDFAERDDAFFGRLRSDAKATFERGVAFAKEHGSVFEATAENFERMIDEERKIHFYWALPACHLYYTMEKLLIEQAAVDGVDAGTYIASLPPLETPLLSRERELRVLRTKASERVRSELERDAGFMSAFEEHRERYGWITLSNWVGEPLTKELLWEHVMQESPLDEPHEPMTIPEGTQKAAARLFSVAYAKQAGAEHQGMFTYHFLPFLRKVAEKLGLSYTELISLTHKEVLAALRGELSAEELIKRAKRRESLNWAVIIGEDGYAEIVEDEEDVKTLSVLIPKFEKNAQELKGQPGYKGVVRAPAKIIMNSEEFHKLLPGDILVTSMTTPDFVVLMQKSAGIVTNIGGLLSHAAIMSRELKKPCIVGTKFATDVFKDGDMLELDAGKGVVRKV